MASASGNNNNNPSNVDILETVEDIQVRREQVLDRYEHFKNAANIRRDKLLQSKAYAFFKFDADDLESWIHEKLRIANEDVSNDVTNIQTKLSRHEAFEAECTAHAGVLSNLDMYGQELINNQHYASAKIIDQLNHLHRLWDELCEALRYKHAKLIQLSRLVAWNQDVTDMMYWIADKEAEIMKPSSSLSSAAANQQSDELGDDGASEASGGRRELERIESERKRYDDIQKDLSLQEPKVLVLGARAEELIEKSDGVLPSGEIRDKQRELNQAWTRLKNLAIQKQESLYGAHEMQRFLRDVEETISWMDEKSASLQHDPVTTSSPSSQQQDLTHIASLQRKHDAFERSLSTLGEKVEALEREGARLARIPSNARAVPGLNAKLDELNSKWNELNAAVLARRQRLEATRRLYQFLADSMDLLVWYDEIGSALGQDDKHVRDIESVQSLIDRNREYKKELESRDEPLQRTLSQGEELIKDQHHDDNVVRDRLDRLLDERRRLDELWALTNRRLSERLDFQLFMRHADQLDNWIRRQEAMLASANSLESTSLNDVEILLKKHADFEKSLLAQEEKVRALSEQADQLIVDENHMKNEIRARRNDLSHRFERLREASEARRADLDKQMIFFTYERDCEEMLVWLAEKLKLAQTTEYLEAANLQAKLQKHVTFEAEVMRQETRVNNLCEQGAHLAQQLPAEEQGPRIDMLVTRLETRWNELFAATRIKGMRLRQAIEAQLFYRTLGELDIWLNESQHTANSSDLGRDLATTILLRRRLGDLEDEWTTKRARVRLLDQELDRLLRGANNDNNEPHFDEENLRESGAAVQQRFYALEEPIRVRKARLDEATKTHEMRRELGDEDQWIWEKELALNARKKIPTDYIEVKKMVQKHQTFVSELTGHEPRVSDTISRCEALIAHADIHAELGQPLQRLKRNWDALKRASEERRVELDEALNVANYFAEASEAETWMSEKEQLVAAAGNKRSSELGRDEDATEATLKRHSATMIDIEAFGDNTVYGDLKNLAAKCKQSESGGQQEEKRSSRTIEIRDMVEVLYDYAQHGVTVKAGDVLPLLDTKNAEWWKVELRDGRKDYVPANYVQRVKQISRQKPSSVALRQQQIERQYENLLALARQQARRLQDAADMHRLSREAGELEQWLDIKKEITNDLLKAHQDDPNLSKDSLDSNLDALKQELRAKEAKLAELLKTAERLRANNQTDEANKIYEEIERQRKSLEQFRRYVESLEVKLMKANELKRFQMDTDDTLEWINEKKQYLADQKNIDLEKSDLATVKRLLRQHDAFELDLDALSQRMQELDARCERLMQEHPDQAGALYEGQMNLQKAWSELVQASTDRKGQLIDAFNYQSYLSNHRDLKLWVDTKTAQVASDELANDEPSLEALIERNQEHKSEIDAREDTFVEFNRYTSELVNAQHPQSADISKKTAELNNDRSQLIRKWEAREAQLNQCLTYILFERDCQSAEKWMTTREQALETPEQSSTPLEDAFRKYEDIDRAINMQEAKIARLSYTAEELVGMGHYASPQIKSRIQQVLDRWDRLKEALIESRIGLDESKTVEQFLHEAKEMEEWLDDKLMAVDELAQSAMLSTGDILRKQQKQELIDTELASNSERVKYVISSGEKLLENKKCPGQEAEVSSRVRRIDSKWNELSEKSAENALRIKEGLRKKRFDASVQDMEFWLSMVESQLESTDLGRDLTSVQNLLKKNQAIEADIQAHEEPLNELNNTDKSGKYDELLRPINERYNRVKKSCAERKSQLTEANSLFQVAHELDDEEAWLREKRLTASSPDYGRDLPSTQNLRKRHKRLEDELATHEPIIENLNAVVERLPFTDANDPTLANLRERASALMSGWRELSALVEERGRRLDENVAFYKWLAMMSEELAWLRESSTLIVDVDGREKECGETLAQAQGWIKKHEAFETDLAVHKERVDTLVKKGDELIASGNVQKEKIQETNENVLGFVETIEKNSRIRKQRLHENWSRLQFYWRCETVEAWIMQREDTLRLNENVSNVTGLVRINELIAKHETFSNNLKAFEKEGIYPLIDAKDELLKAETQTQEKPKINERFDIVYTRWRRLAAASEARWTELRQAEARIKEVDDLLLLFAKRAYELNSWFENAEEDLSDPVRCFSLEQINDMFKAHDSFLASFTQVVQDIEDIKELDVRIKKVYKNPNPYTWHTSQSLIDNWTVLQRANTEREADLEKERQRQVENDHLRKEYARAAKEFYRWLTDTRVDMLDMGSNSTATLEEQLNMTCIKLDEIQKAGPRFEPVEQLNAKLEERLVFDNKYTEHTTLALAQAWDQLEQLGLRMVKNLEQQIQARNQTGVTEQSLREFSHIFRHFDAEKHGRLTHEQFKMCLRALGYDLVPDELRMVDLEFERILDIVDPQRVGYISLQDYMSFLISKETENISSMNDVVDAFRALTENGDKPFITRRELVTNLSPDQAEYCLHKMRPYRDATGREIPDAYDYIHFANTLFTR